jgi:acetyl-CoA acetyltransferase
MKSIKDATAIVGVATTEFATDSGRTEYSMACEVIKAAADDAGVRLEDIDGMVKDVVDGIDAMYVQKALGMETLTYSSDSHWGTSPLMNAVTAIAAGICNHVVYFRSANNGSGKRAGSDFRAAKETKDESLDLIRYDLHHPFGLMGPAGSVGMCVRRYLADYGVTAEQVGWVPVVCSEHGAENPHAIFHDAPIKLGDYLASEMVVDPLRRLDIAPEVDGAIAIVLSSAERAPDLSQSPVYVQAVAQGTGTEGEHYSSYSREVLSRLPEMELMGRELFRVAGVGPEDLALAQLDDRFAPLVPMQLEALGFCGEGEGGAFCEGGDNLRVGGRLALNTGGGFLGEGFSHGVNVIEAVRQMRGSSPNQVAGAELVMVATGAGGPADGVILHR